MVNNMNNQNQGGQDADNQRDKNKSREDQRNKQGEPSENVNEDM